jgi:hypothetical protein
VHFPVPWSRASETSFLVTSDAMKSALEPTGFKVVAWDDRTQAAVDWFAEQAEGPRRCPGRRAPSPPPLGRHVAMGTYFPPCRQNSTAISGKGASRSFRPCWTGRY